MIKRRKIVVVALAILFFGMLICYFAVLRPMLQEQDDKGAELTLVDGEAAGPNNRYLLFEHTERENISSIFIHNAHGEYSIVKNSLNQLVIKDFENITLKDQSLSALVVASGYVIARERITEKATEEELLEYGLDSPQAYWTLTSSDGKTHTVNVGNKLVSGEGYYCSYEGRSCVYVLGTDIENSILAPAESYVNPLLCIGMTENDYFTADNFNILHKSEPFISVKQCSDEEKSNPDAQAETKLLYPEGYKTNDTLFFNVLAKFVSFAGEEAAVLGPSDEEYEMYGLDEPYYSIYFTFGDIEYLILVSSLQDDGYYYAVSNIYDYQVIVKCSEDDFNWLEYELEDWVNKYPIMFNITNVDSISVLTQDKSEKFTLTHGTSDDKKATLDVISDSGFSISNEDIYNFKQFYKVLLAIQIQGRTDLTNDEIKLLTSDDNSHLLTVIFALDDGNKMEYAFYEYSTRRVLMTINENGEFYVSIDNVEKIISDMDKLLRGIDIDSYAKN